MTQQEIDNMAVTKFDNYSMLYNCQSGCWTWSKEFASAFSQPLNATMAMALAALNAGHDSMKCSGD